jgi:hypothetical protein
MKTVNNISRLSSIAQVVSKNYMELASGLYDRWQYESQCEDIKTYAKKMETEIKNDENLNDIIKVTLTKRPFQFTLETACGYVYIKITARKKEIFIQEKTTISEAPKTETKKTQKVELTNEQILEINKIVREELSKIPGYYQTFTQKQRTETKNKIFENAKKKVLKK